MRCAKKVVTSWLVMLPLGIVISMPAPASGQERVLRDSGVTHVQPGLARAPAIQVIRRGEGTAEPDLGQPPPDPPPPRLTLAQKAALVTALGELDMGMGPWLVDVRRPTVQPTASLMFWDAGLVDSRMGWAPLPGEPSGKVVLSFTPPDPNRSYLVHCTATESGTYTVKPVNSKGELSFTDVPIQFVYDPAGEMGEEWFRISRYTSGGFAWWFYGCEITALQ